MSPLIVPHGGELVQLVVDTEHAAELKARSREWLSWDLTPAQMCDVELLLNGGFSPLRGFMGREDFESVCSRMRLADSTLWPVPVTLKVGDAFARKLSVGDRVALRDPEGVMLAALSVDELWKADPDAEAAAVFGTTDPAHRGVARVLERPDDWCIGGPLQGIQLPVHFDSRSLRLSPKGVRRELERLGWNRVIAFQSRDPVHRAHFELTLRAIEEHEANLLLHPAVGTTEPGDIEHFTRVRCYQALLRHYPQHTARLALLPLARRLAGPREALWHAIIHRNFGCSHLIVERDHAGAGSSAGGTPFYGPHDAQKLVAEHEDELGVRMVPLTELTYVEAADTYLRNEEVPAGAMTLSFSGAELRECLARGREIPAWFTFPEVARELRHAHPPRRELGFTVFFTGLSGSGKSTVANAFRASLLEMGGRRVTLLDGDIVRKNLSSELGFSREHRNLNVLRIGFVANEITKNGGIAICAPIAPYDDIRKQVRQLIEPSGGFVLVHLATPLEVCESRDRKGLYAKARAGILREFTGISDPYEPPEDAEIEIDTTRHSPQEAARKILLYLENQGYLGSGA